MNQSNTEHRWLSQKITLPIFVIVGIILAVVIVKSQARILLPTGTSLSKTEQVVNDMLTALNEAGDIL
jgi:hypothetical protein